jgi:hypothetical protein
VNASTRQYAERAVALNAQFEPAYNVLANSLMTAGDAGAIDVLTKLVALDPAEIRYALQLSSALTRFHRYDEAVAAAQRAAPLARNDQDRASVQQMVQSAVRARQAQQASSDPTARQPATATGNADAPDGSRASPDAAAPSDARNAPDPDHIWATFDATATGRLTNIVCSAGAPIVELATASGVVRLVIDQPLGMQILGTGSPTMEFSCGAQKNKMVRIGYESAPDAVTKTAGHVRLLDFQ